MDNIILPEHSQYFHLAECGFADNLIIFTLLELFNCDEFVVVWKRSGEVAVAAEWAAVAAAATTRVLKKRKQQEHRGNRGTKKKKQTNAVSGGYKTHERTTGIIKSKRRRSQQRQYWMKKKNSTNLCCDTSIQHHMLPRQQYQGPHICSWLSWEWRVKEIIKNKERGGCVWVGGDGLCGGGDCASVNTNLFVVTVESEYPEKFTNVVVFTNSNYSRYYYFVVWLCHRERQVV